MDTTETLQKRRRMNRVQNLYTQQIVSQKSAETRNRYNLYIHV
jgi:hypothetical protein